MRANLVIEQLRAVLLRDGAGLSDGQLLECFIAGREDAAFEALVRRHGPMVLGVCRRVLGNDHDAEDAFQATFLVLVRKAASVVPREMVGNWLHGVAYRTALRARAVTAKRRERQLSGMPEPQAPQEHTGRDLQQLLEKELNGLPERYRAPLILCELEGKSEKEAARYLGLPQGTLSGRLSRARALLAKRLARHGVALSLASPSVPTSVLDSTIKAASAGQAAAVSAKVASITEGVLTAMFLSKVKSAMALLLAGVVLVCGSGLLLSRVGGSDNSDQKPQTRPSDPRDSTSVQAEAKEIALAYLTNAAQFDEMFNGKRVTVTGKIKHITGGEVGDAVAKTSHSFDAAKPPGSARYYLEMNPTGYSVPLPRLIFVFNSSERKKLAKLRAGQDVTLEGEAQPLDGMNLRFSNCKVIKPKVDD
jgi:RNA polymerase sigma factor (sigma-70 family)